MLTKFNRSRFFVKLQSALLNFCHLTIFFPIILLSAILSFFCQIVMGSPFNNNVPEGRSVQLNKQYLIWKLTSLAKIWNLSEVTEAHSVDLKGVKNDRGENENLPIFLCKNWFVYQTTQFKAHFWRNLLLSMDIDF